jgi:hypothetical protein
VPPELVKGGGDGHLRRDAEGSASSRGPKSGGNPELKPRGGKQRERKTNGGKRSLEKTKGEKPKGKNQREKTWCTRQELNLEPADP